MPKPNAIKNAKYWQERFLAVEAMGHKISVDAVKNIAEAYERSKAQLRKDIASWYQRFSDNNDVSLLDARRMLSARELQELRWTVEEYIEKGKTLEYSDRWAKQLENASARVHISRLEALELQCRQKVEEIYAKQREVVPQSLKKQYKEAYLATTYEIGIGTRAPVRVDFAKINNDALEKIIKKPWSTDGKTFSARIWNNQAELSLKLQQELTRMAITGDSPDEAIRRISRSFNVDQKKTARLVMTEGAAMATEGEKASYKELGVEEYEILATLDAETCESCGGMDGKHFPVALMQTGVTAPPFHPWCRCDTVPWIDEEELAAIDPDTPFDFGTRAARDPETGKTVQVPADMSYKEWKKELQNEREVEYGVQYDNPKIDWIYILSDDFRRKFDGLVEDETIDTKIYETSMEILKHRDGTEYEDMVYLDAMTGKEIASQRSMRYEMGIEYNQEMIDVIRKSQSGDVKIIAIHNHPNGTPPSIDDFNKATVNNYFKSIVIGHNGEVYEYGTIPEVISKNECELLHESIANDYEQGISIDRAYKPVLEYIKGKYARR